MVGGGKGQLLVPVNEMASAGDACDRVITMAKPEDFIPVRTASDVDEALNRALRVSENT